MSIKGLFSAIDISATGLTAQRTKMNAISSNIANKDATRTEEGGPYRRKDVVVGAIPETESFGDVLDGKMEENFQRVQVMDVISDPNAPKMVYKPNHADANEDGYVAMPNINPVTEMVNLMQASTAYKAAAQIVQVTKDMRTVLRQLAARF